MNGLTYDRHTGGWTDTWTINDQLVNAFQMGTHNLCFHKENQKEKKKQKNIALASLDKCPADPCFVNNTLSIGGYIFYHKFSQSF